MFLIHQTYLPLLTERWHDQITIKDGLDSIYTILSRSQGYTIQQPFHL
jgi:hypothetical protein